MELVKQIDELYLVQSSAYKLELRIISDSEQKVRWWPIVGKPPVPIPNTVVKTYRGENTWLPASILRKKRELFRWLIFAFFSWMNSRLVNHPLSANVTFSHLCFGRVIPNTVVKTYRGGGKYGLLEFVVGVKISGSTTSLAYSWEDSTLPVVLMW